MNLIKLWSSVKGADWEEICDERDKEDGMVASGLVDNSYNFIPIEYYYCHAGAWYYEGDKNDIIAIATHTDKFLCEEENALIYYDWLFNRSVFADVYIDAMKGLEENIILTRTDVPHDFLLDALIAIRIPWENYFSSHLYRTARAFAHYTKLGLDEDAAFVLSHHVYQRWPFKIRQMEAGHEPIKLNNYSTFCNFVKRTPKKTGDNYNTLQYSHKRSNPNKLWDNSNLKNLDPVILMLQENDIEGINILVGEIRGNA